MAEERGGEERRRGEEERRGEDEEWAAEGEERTGRGVGETGDGPICRQKTETLGQSKPTQQGRSLARRPACTYMLHWRPMARLLLALAVALLTGGAPPAPSYSDCFTAARSPDSPPLLPFGRLPVADAAAVHARSQAVPLPGVG